MDVPGQAFGEALLPMLRSLTTSHFVSLDFEMSGVPAQAFKAAGDATGRGNRQTVQQRYTDLKHAAEKYQILQVGITIVNYDKIRGVYVVQPWNMYLNPLIDDHFAVDRDVCFQNMATGFLLKNGFDMGAPFHWGVPYLSRDEQARAIAKEHEKRDISNLRDIKLGRDEVESRKFVDRARRTIRAWYKSRPRPESVVVAPEGFELGMSAGLSNFQKRLVHQLVRSDFPDCVTVSRPGVIQVAAYDAQREASVQLAKWDAFETRLRAQIGMRWFFEALIGGSIEHIDPRVFVRQEPGRPTWLNTHAMALDFGLLQQLLRSRRYTLVGHNVLVDLVFFHQTFIGPLPDRVADFADRIHRLFPRVVDTKFMATRHATDQSYPSQLVDVDAEACTYEFPLIEAALHHERYLHEQPVHEAGYDSFMTARLAIRLAHKLESLGLYKRELEASEQLERAKNADSGAKPVKILRGNEPAKTKFAHEGKFDLLVGPFDEPDGFEDAKKSPSPCSDASARTVKASPGVSGATLHDNADHQHDQQQLPDTEDGWTKVPERGLINAAIAAANAAGTAPSGQPLGFNAPMELPPTPADPPTPPSWPPAMPSWRKPFWRVYGNRLRVNGTLEGVLHLGKEDAANWGTAPGAMGGGMAGVVNGVGVGASGPGDGKSRRSGPRGTRGHGRR